MNCEWVKSQITLYAFEELGDADRAEVEKHLERCRECAREADAEKQLRQVMDLRPRLEVSSALLAECRSELAEALEDLPVPAAIETESSWRRLTGFLSAPFLGLRLQWQAGLAILLLSVGFTGGSFWTRWHGGAENTDVNEAGIANVQSISARPDGSLDIALDTTRRKVVSGRPDDPRIKELLVYGLRNYYNSGIQLESIDLLKNRTQDEQIRSALISALKNDRNPGVRLKAIDALQGLESTDVKNAFIDVLLKDGNPGVRIKAIDQLVGQLGQRDKTVISTLQRLAEGDSNNYIRMKSASTLLKWDAPVETY